MKFNRNSFWYNLFIFPFSPEREYHYRNLCAVFWKTVINTIVWFTIVPIMFGILFGAFGAFIVKEPLVFLCILGIFAVIFGGIWLAMFKLPGTKAGQAVVAFKEDHCPRIEYTNGDK